MIIVGLGNIGKEYENTHHNVGFMAIDVVAKANQLEFKLEKKFLLVQDLVVVVAM